MKKILAVAAVVLASFSAYGQDSYSQAVEKQRRCQGIGELWAESWEKNTVLGKRLKQYSREQESGKISMDTMQFVLMIFIKSPHKEKFRNSHDAYMAGWAECMDER